MLRFRIIKGSGYTARDLANGEARSNGRSCPAHDIPQFDCVDCRRIATLRQDGGYHAEQRPSGYGTSA